MKDYIINMGPGKAIAWAAFILLVPYVAIPFLALWFAYHHRKEIIQGIEDFFKEF